MNRTVTIGLGLLMAAGSLALVSADQKDTSVSGELVDTYCFASMGAKGASHKDCATACAKKGIPVAVLEKGTNKLYVLLPSKDKGVLPESVTGKMAEDVTVTGHSYSSGGVTFLTVESVK